MKHFKVCAGTLLIRSCPGDDNTLLQQVQWLNDHAVMKYSEQRHHIHTLGSQRTYYKMFTGSNLFLGIYVGDEQIGTMTVYNDDPNGVANVGIMIGNRDFWGMGHGFDAWKALCTRLFETGTRKIEAGCMEGNRAMVSICAGYGMALEGRQAGHFLWNNKPMDLLHWGKLR